MAGNMISMIMPIVSLSGGGDFRPVCSQLEELRLPKSLISLPLLHSLLRPWKIASHYWIPHQTDGKWSVWTEILWVLRASSSRQISVHLGADLKICLFIFFFCDVNLSSPRTSRRSGIFKESRAHDPEFFQSGQIWGKWVETPVCWTEKAQSG